MDDGNHHDVVLISYKIGKKSNSLLDTRVTTSYHRRLTFVEGGGNQNGPTSSIVSRALGDTVIVA